MIVINQIDESDGRKSRARLCRRRSPGPEGEDEAIPEGGLGSTAVLVVSRPAAEVVQNEADSGEPNGLDIKDDPCAGHIGESRCRHDSGPLECQLDRASPSVIMPRETR